jgi:hypothetical protein
MSIIAQPRSRPVNSLRIAIWSGFLLGVFLPVVLERGGHPYYSAVLLRPGGLVLGFFSPHAMSARAITVTNFCLYTVVIYAALRLFLRRRNES